MQTGSLMNGDVRIADLGDMGVSGNIMIALQLYKKFNQSYSVFCDLVNKAIDYSSTEMSMERNILKGMDENQLTNKLLSPIKAMSFDASHETNVNGHCDIVIKGARGMLWLGEAKIFSAYDLVLKGFQQLVDRYSTGLPNQDQGSLILYVQSRNAKGIIDNWRSYLQQYNGTAVITFDTTKPLEFTSETTNLASGLPVTTRHLPVVLYHAPTDVKPRPKRIVRSQP